MNILEIIKPQEIKARAYLTNIESVSILTEADNLAACETLREITAFTKTINAQKKEETAKLKQELDEINAAYKSPLDFLKKADSLLREKINNYATKKMQEAVKRAEAGKAAKEEAALEQLEKMEKFKKDADKYDEVTKTAILESISSKENEIINNTAKQEKINISNSSATFRELWTFEVVDISKVPAEYLLVNSTAVNNAIKSGVREINGLNIKKEIKVAVK